MSARICVVWSRSQYPLAALASAGPDAHVSVFVKGSRNGDIFTIFRRRPRGIAFAICGGTNDAFAFLTGFGKNCNSGTLKALEESTGSRGRNRGGAYD